MEEEEGNKNKGDKYLRGLTCSEQRTSAFLSSYLT